MYYYAQNIKPEKELVDGKLSIQMNHAFCMIDINVTLGTEFNVSGVPTASPITKVTLGGTITEANVNVTNGTDKVTASTTAAAKDITATKGEFETPADNDKEKSCISHFSCITVPQNVAAKTFKVSLKTADKLYEWTSEAAVELKSGYRYTLNLSMGNDVVLLKGGSITATEWKPGTGGSLETD